MIRHRIPHDFLGCTVQDGYQVDKSLPGTDAGNISHPFPSRCLSGEVALHQVWSDSQVGGRGGGADLSARTGGDQASLAHEAAHSVM